MPSSNAKRAALGARSAAKPPFSCRVLRQESDTLVAIADREIVGKSFEEGELQLEVATEFYHERHCSASEIRRLCESATIINAVGAEIIDFLVQEQIVNSQNIIRIQGVPHAQVIVVR